MTETIIRGPWSTSRGSGQTARSMEIARIAREFRHMRRRDADVFQHLSLKVWSYLAEAEKEGPRSGVIGHIIGGDSDGTARHRARFSWNGEQRDFAEQPLCKNAGQWLGVLQRCAAALKRSPEDLLLDAFSGSRLRPVATPIEYSQLSWLGSFLDLAGRLEDQLCGRHRADGLLNYIADAHLEFDDNGDLVGADDPLLPWFRSDIPEWTDILGQIPFAPLTSNLIAGYSYGPGRTMDSTERDAWNRLFDICTAGAWLQTHQLSLLMLIRKGMAVIPRDGKSRPSLALFKWPSVTLVASKVAKQPDGNSRSLDLPLDAHPVIGEILHPAFEEFAPHLVERISFAPFGSDAFAAFASESFPDFQETGRGTIDICWDPLFAEEGQKIDWASSAPKSTLAASIERNLLFADEAGVPQLRIDRLLDSQISRMAEAVRKHRVQVEQIVGPARRNLLASWPDVTQSNGKNST